MKSRSQIVALVGCLWATAVYAADSYPVKLSVPHKVGDKASITTKVTSKLSVKWTDPGNARPATDKSFSAELEGTETVTAVSKNGRVTGLTFEVKQCTSDGAELMPAGLVVAAENKDGVTVFTINGNKPAPELVEYLNVLIYTARPDEPTTDDEFGTDRPQKVGDTWKANTDQLAKATHLPFVVTGEDFRGEATLVDVSTVDGKQMQKVKLTDSCAFDKREGKTETVKNLKVDREFTMTFSAGEGRRDGTTKASLNYRSENTGKNGTREVHREVTWESGYAEIEK
jgi:hypothetical protein